MLLAACCRSPAAVDWVTNPEKHSQARCRSFHHDASEDSKTALSACLQDLHRDLLTALAAGGVAARRDQGEEKRSAEEQDSWLSALHRYPLCQGGIDFARALALGHRRRRQPLG